MESTRKRKRKRCLKCGQELSHSAYNTHKRFKVCGPTTNDPLNCSTTSSVSSTIDSTLVLETSEDNDELSVSELDGTSSSSSEELSESEEEIIVSDEEEMLEYDSQQLNVHGNSQDTPGTDKVLDDTHVQSQDTHNSDNVLDDTQRQNTPDTNNVLDIEKTVIHIGLFLLFFQLCYHVSERGISLLLSFLKALFQWVYMIGSTSHNLKLLSERMPSNVYFLKKNYFRGKGYQIICIMPKMSCYLRL